MVINLKNTISRCHTNEEGQAIFDVLKPLLHKGEHVEVSFQGVNSVTSSFINSAFIDLLRFFSFGDIKSLITFKNTTAEINKIIKKRFVFETEKRQKMAD